MSKETTHEISPKYFCGEDWHSLFGIGNKTDTEPCFPLRSYYM